MDDDILENLFTAKSRIRGTDEYIALDYAKHLKENTDDSTLKQAYEKIANQIRKKMKDSGVLVEEEVDGWSILPFHHEETLPAPEMVGDSGNGIDKNALFDELVNAIKNGDCIDNILQNKAIQAVLNLQKIESHIKNTTIYDTVLTYAIYHNIEAARSILKAANHNTLEELLEAKQTIESAGSESQLSALDCAKSKKNYYTRMNIDERNNLLIQDLESLIKEIKGKMNDLKIPITDENAVDKSIKFLGLQPLYHKAGNPDQQTGNQNQRAKVQGVPQGTSMSKKKDTALLHNHGKTGDSGNSSSMEDIHDNSRRGDEAKVSGDSGKDGNPHTSLNGGNGPEKGNKISQAVQQITYSGLF